MKKRMMSLLLALTVILSLCAVSAVAGEKAEEPAGQTAAEGVTEAVEGETSDAEEGVVDEEISWAGPEAREQDETKWDITLDEETQKLLQDTLIKSEAVTAIDFGDVERQMRKNGLTVLALQESIDMIESIDYDEWYDELRDQINQIADGQWYMNMTGQGDSYAYAQAQMLYDGLREQFDGIKEGTVQRDNAAAMHQVRDLQDQIIMGGEMMYVTLVGLETQEAALQRQLASLNRTMEEMELRYNMGQISALQLSQTKAGQMALVSGLETLRMNIQTCKRQLEMMLGAAQTGEIQLGTVPEVTEKQFAAMNVEEDLLKAKAQSYELYAAAKTLENEQETYKDAGKANGYREEEMAFRKAKHDWQAAQYTYNNTIQNYELRFRNLYAQVVDYKQIWEAAKISLESQKLSFAASEMKYQQGTISQNTYLTAQDDLRAAEEKVQTAANDLFASYNTYCWAVQHGILA